MASSALLLILIGYFFLAFAEGKELSAADALGCPETTVRVVATEDSPTMAFVGPQLFTEAMASLAVKHRLSVAFSPDNVPDLITLLDEYEFFTVAGAQAREELAAGTGSSVAAVSASVAQAGRQALIPDGVQVIGEFTPTVSFDGASYPAVLLSPAAAPFSSGVYLIAGADPSNLGPVIRLFESQGMVIQSIAVQDPPTLANRLSSIYGGISISLVGILVVGSFLTTQIQASSARDQLVAAAVLGATRRDQWLLVQRRLAPQALVGLAIGCGVCLGFSLGAQQLLLTAPASATAAVLAALGVCVIIWGVILASVAAWELRRCQRVVPC